MSVWSKDGTRKVPAAELALKEAVKLLAGVGGDCEWWIYGGGPNRELVGYLRVPVTEIEYQLCPSGTVITDAGETGPQRPRTYLK